MKKIIYVTTLAILSLLLVNSVCGQERNLMLEQKQLESKALQEKFDQAASLSKAAGELRTKLENGVKNAAFDAVKSCDASLIPLLELYANNGISRNIYHGDTLQRMPYLEEYNKQNNGDADAALAKSGRTEYLTRILNQTDKSKNERVRGEAVRKLFLIGNKEAYKKLLELLDDTVVPQSHSDHVGLISISEGIMYKLAETEVNPPNLNNVDETDKKILLWKKWFEQHKELTDGAETLKCNVAPTPTAIPMISNTDNSFLKEALFTDYLSVLLLTNLLQV
jgi:hypothetical protein